MKPRINTLDKFKQVTFFNKLLVQSGSVVFCLSVSFQRNLRVHNVDMGPLQIVANSDLIVTFFERENVGSMSYNPQIHYLPCFKLVPTTKYQ